MAKTITNIPYNLRLPKPLKAKLEKEARENRRSLNQYLVILLENHVLNRDARATGQTATA